jgi:Ca-activated chloride channel homolog
MSSEQPDYYRILGVSPQDSLETIQAAYIQARKKIPTKNKTVLQLIQTAYEVLGDPDRRAIYDDLLQEVQQPELQIDLDLSRDTLSISDQDQLLYLLVEITTDRQKENPQNQRPLNLCFVVDRSTSMKGERLHRVKEAASLIFEKLTPDDVVSLISFSDRADVVIAATDNTNIRLLRSRINSINASGGTEIYQGLAAAYQQLNSVSPSGYNNHLILLTDGRTYGDESQCLEMAQKMATQGIDMSAFGIGAEWNDQFLDELVAPSGGRSDFIESPEQVLRYLQERIQGLGTVHARNIRLLSHFSQVATITYGFKLSPFTQPLELLSGEIKLGNLEGRSPLSFLLEVRIVPQPREARIRLPIELVADMATTAVNSQEKSYRTNAQCLVLSEASPSEAPSPHITKAVRMMTLYRMNEKAWTDAQAGDLDQATRRMNHLTTRLLEAGETRLAQQTQMEANRLAHLGTMSLEGRKAIKYGTRALINESLTLDKDD